MGYLAYRDKSSNSHVLSEAQYTSVAGGTARLNIKTASNGTLKYGFTTDTSATAYCKLAFNVGGKTAYIGRTQSYQQKDTYYPNTTTNTLHSTAPVTAASTTSIEYFYATETVTTSTYSYSSNQTTSLQTQGQALTFSAATTYNTFYIYPTYQYVAKTAQAVSTTKTEALYSTGLSSTSSYSSSSYDNSTFTYSNQAAYSTEVKTSSATGWNYYTSTSLVYTNVISDDNSTSRLASTGSLSTQVTKSTIMGTTFSNTGKNTYSSSQTQQKTSASTQSTLYTKSSSDNTYKQSSSIKEYSSYYTYSFTVQKGYSTTSTTKYKPMTGMTIYYSIVKESMSIVQTPVISNYRTSYTKSNSITFSSKRSYYSKTTVSYKSTQAQTGANYYTAYTTLSTFSTSYYQQATTHNAYPYLITLSNISTTATKATGTSYHTKAVTTATNSTWSKTTTTQSTQSTSSSTSKSTHNFNI